LRVLPKQKKSQNIEQDKVEQNAQSSAPSYSNDVELNSLNSVSYFMNTSLNTENVSMDNLKNYVKYPMIYNSILREISRIAYSENGVYANTIDYMIAIPTLAYITTLRNKTSALKKKKKNFNTILKIINHERTTRDVLRHLFIDGLYVGILRDTTANNKTVNMGVSTIEAIDRIEGLSLDDNFMIQPLDLDYCKIIGFQNNISIAAFDMMYFDQFKYGGLVNEIKNYPTEFYKGYLAYKKDASKRWFVLDYKKTVALKCKATEEEPYGRPLGISAFVDMKMANGYKDGQYKLINELASSIYYLILPQGEKVGSCSLNKNQQEEIISAFKSAVKINTFSDTTKISTLSLAPGTQIDRLSKDSSLLKDTLSDELLKSVSTNLGFASSALNASSEGGASYSSLQVNIDLISAQIFQYVNEIAREETRVINENLGIKPSDYIEISYLPISWLNKDTMYTRAKELFTLAGGSRKYLISAAGFEPDSYLAMCDEENEENYDEKYLPHLTSYTMSDSADKSNPDDNMGGAPKKDEKDLKPSGQVTRNTNSNKQKKVSTNK
jgi:hypothetical protein